MEQKKNMVSRRRVTPGEAQRLIRRLNLAPHPEGGFFRQAGLGSVSSAICYLMLAGRRSGSRLHRLSGLDEHWTHVQGDAVEMLQVGPDGVAQRLVLGQGRGQLLYALVPRDTWQGARVRSSHRIEPQGFALVTCVVAPCFDEQRFELASKPLMLELLGQHQDKPDIGRMLRQFVADVEPSEGSRIKRNRRP